MLWFVSHNSFLLVRRYASVVLAVIVCLCICDKSVFYEDS